MDSKNPAPKFLNLLQIKLPPGGIASIGHRVSGVLMFLAVPLAAWLLALSLHSEQGYRQALAYLQSPVLQVLSLILVWSFCHHLLAGIRHLLLDIDVGVDRAQARLSAWIVNIGALALSALYLAVRL